MGYIEPSLYESGDVVGRSNVGLLIDNDNHFNGMADRYRVPVHAPTLTARAGPTSEILWNGYHYLTPTAKTGVYHVIVTTGTWAATIRLKYGDEVIVGPTEVPASTTQTFSSTYDLSSLSASTVYNVELKITDKDENDNMTSVTFHPFYTKYTGSQTYGVPTDINTGLLSDESHFNRWVRNDWYFNACTPCNPPFHQCEHAWFSEGPATLTLFDGWIRHAHEQIRYKVYSNQLDANSRIRIIYDYDNESGNKHTQAITTFDSENLNEGTFDLTTGDFTYASFYRVVVEMWRSVTTDTGQGKVFYLYTAPKTNFEGYNPTLADFNTAYFHPMDDLTPGDWVYGNSGGGDRELDYLTRNDRNLFERLCWHAIIGRQDFAVRSNAGTIYTPAPIFTHRLKRIHDTLIYRGTDLVMRWGDSSSRALQDATTANPFRTLDLRNVTDLMYGQQYYIDGSCDYAMEIP